MSSLRQRLKTLVPTTILGRLTLYVLGLRLAVGAAQLAGALSGREVLAGWGLGLTIVFACFFTLVALRWVRRVFMWRLRNRLIVTYVFIGVIPVVLILSMVGIAGWLFATQYATSQAMIQLEAELRALAALNTHLALDQTSGAAIIEMDNLRRREPALELAFWRDGKRIAGSADLNVPAWVKDGFQGVVVANGKLYLRAMTARERDGHSVQMIASTAVNNALLDRVMGDFGLVRIFLPRRTAATSRGAGLVIRDDDAGRKENLDFQLQAPDAAGGKVPPQRGRFDAQRDYASVSPYRNWDSGSESIAVLRVTSRYSALGTRLFSTRGEFAAVALALLMAIASVFALIELIAVIVGVRLTGTITGSVYRLYKATQHINRGDLRHRIEVTSEDQLAALQKSFNSMAGSLEELIEEQKEKQRLQNELEIAHEVQATLFPRESVPMKSLELHGVCRPARTVSGDYYDFIPTIRDGHEQLVVAVGDISGKGISAALLMATLHSAVRVYEFGGMPTRREFIHAGAAIAGAAHVSESPREMVTTEPVPSPAQVLTLLNKHLFHSTQPEKYATLFLGLYDGSSRSFTYSNAGHLPPLVIAADGSVRKLETGGMVIGLFDNMAYEDGRVDLRPGEILVAYSDGITEPENEFGEFGEARLIELVRANRHLPLARISEIVIATAREWIGSAEQPDDVTLVLARAL